MNGSTSRTPGDDAQREIRSASEQPGARVWSVPSALALVAMSFVSTLLAGIVLSAIRDLGWSPVVRALAVGGVLGGVYAMMLGVVWAASKAMGETLATSVGAGRPPTAGWYSIALAAAMGVWLFSIAFNVVLTALRVEIPREDLALFNLMPPGVLGVAIMAALLTVVAPIAEEVIYRGVLLTALEDRWGRRAALVVSALVFAAVHASIVGFVPLVVVGLTLGWLFISSRSVRVTILAHAFFNSLGVAVLLAQKSSGLL